MVCPKAVLRVEILAAVLAHRMVLQSADRTVERMGVIWVAETVDLKVGEME